MPTTLTKAAINKLLVAERASMRSKHKQSAFMKRTLSIYNGQKSRAKDLKQTVEYTLADLRTMVDDALKIGICPYCQMKLTLSKLALDHALPVSQGGLFTKMNMVVCCAPCNWQKSDMSAKQFIDFTRFIVSRFPSDVVGSIRRRLVIGGRWSPR